MGWSFPIRCRSLVDAPFFQDPKVRSRMEGNGDQATVVGISLLFVSALTAAAPALLAHGVDLL